MLCCSANPSSAASPPSPTVPAPTPNDATELNLLLVNLTLDGDQLSDIVNLYEVNNDVLLPLGELARQLTIGVTVDPVTHVASGFVLHEDQAFRLDPATGMVTLPDHQEAFDPNLVRWIDGDLYVASRLLQRWWPVDFKINMAALNLEAVPREMLPIQLRLKRERAGSKLGPRGTGYQDPGYPRLNNPYRIATVPVIDSTIGLGISRNGDATSTIAAYSGLLTGDLLGMEAAGYISISKDNPTMDARLTLSRHDPDGGLLGPLNATSVQLGNINLPALDNVLTGGGSGNGVIISNRRFNQANSYGLQTLRGELPPGWDVTLYFNDALIDFAQSRGDGLYEFPDQRLVFGRNEFRLVFNGPFGQRRVERQVYMLDQTVTKPGEFYYTVGAKRDDNGAVRQTAQFDVGLARNLALTVGTVYIDRDDGAPAHGYVNAGVRASLLGSLINFDRAQNLDGGSVTELGLKTAVRNVSVDASRIWINNFVSDGFTKTGDPIKIRDLLRFTGAIKLSDHFRLPFAFDLKRQQSVSGLETYSIGQRLSLNIGGTSFTNALTYLHSPGSDNGSGALQVSRRVAGIGVSSQIAYGIAPEPKISSMALKLDKNLDGYNRINFGVVQSFSPSQSTFTAGWTHNFGSFGIGFSGRYGGRHNLGFGIQIFTAIGRNPRNGRLMRDWQPMADFGNVAAKVFLDANENGRFDPGEEPIENAGFRINGSGRGAIRTDANGEAVIPRLQPKAYADVALDPGTLADAQWQPSRPGMRMLPRSGKTQLIDFPVVLTAEIDGTIYLASDGTRRGIGNAKIELVDAKGKVIGETNSASDGYYIMPNVRPGTYHLRIASEQQTGLGLVADGSPEVTINPKGDFVDGIDITLSKADANLDQQPTAAGLGTAMPPPSAPFTPASDGPAVIAQRPVAGPAARAAQGIWRVQLGAFRVVSNAEDLWARVMNRAELAGHPRLRVAAGKLTYLQVGGFVSRADAQAACSRLSASGFDCIPMGS